MTNVYAKGGGPAEGQKKDASNPEPQSSDELVVLRKVTKKFGEAMVLKGIDLIVRRGETTVIIGGSGAGKTTLLRLIVRSSSRPRARSWSRAKTSWV